MLRRDQLIGIMNLKCLNRKRTCNVLNWKPRHFFLICGHYLMEKSKRFNYRLHDLQ